MLRAYEAVNRGEMEALRHAITSEGTKGLSEADGRGMTALHLASQRNQHEMAMIILEGGANANARDKFDLTPLHIACQFNAFEVAQVLVEFGRADLNARSLDGHRPIDVAREAGSTNVCMYLAMASRQIESVDSQTPSSSVEITPRHDTRQVHFTDQIEQPLPSMHRTPSAEHLTIMSQLVSQNEMLIEENQRLKQQLRDVEMTRMKEIADLQEEVQQLRHAMKGHA